MIQSSVELGKRASRCCTQLCSRLQFLKIFLSMWGLNIFSLKKIINEVYFSCMDWSATCVSSLVVALYSLKERKWTKDTFFFLWDSSMWRILVPVICRKYPPHPFPLSLNLFLLTFSFDWLPCLSLIFYLFCVCIFPL